MADRFDPKEIAEYQVILKGIEGILGEIVDKDRSILLSATEKANLANQHVAKLEDTIKLKFQELDAAGKLADNEERRNALLEQHRVNLEQALAKVTTEHYESQRAWQQATEAIENLENQIDSLDRSATTYNASLTALTRRLIDAREEEARLSREQLRILDSEREAIARKITVEMRYTDTKLRSSQAAQSAMTMLFGLDNKWRQTLGASLVETTAAAIKARGVIQGVTESMAHLSTTLSNVGSLSNVMGSGLMKIQETTVMMVGSIDRADVSLRSATGASSDFTDSLTGAFEDKEIKEMAGAYDELSQMQSQLYSVARAYSGLLPSQRLEMDRTALAAKRFGISFDTTAAVMDKSMRVFGIAGPEMMNRLYNSAVAIGETPVRMVQNFTQALDVMSQYSGPRAIQVLQGLSSIAKATGIEMNTLTGIAARFDTFEDAASNVAKLNAILGGAYYNSIQMLNASEEQRLYLLRAGLDATNRSWESLGRWEKKAFAAAAGFKNMNIAAAFFQGNMAKVDELTKLQEQQAESQGKLIMMGGQVVDIFQQIKRVFLDAGFGAKTLLKWVRSVVDIMKTLGFKGLILVKVLWSLANATATWTLRMTAMRAAAVGASSGVGALSIALKGIAPLLIVAGGAWAYFSSKMREKKSPEAFSLPSIAAQGLRALWEWAKKAASPIANLANKIGTISDKKVVSLTRALGAASQISAPELNFTKATTGITELTKAINNLNEKKVDSFAAAIARLGYVMQTIPKENIVAVTQLTKEARSVSALPIVAAARAGAQISAQGAAVQAARASEAPRGGGAGRGLEGVLITDSIMVNVGGTVLTRRIQDTVRDTFAKAQRSRTA